MSYPGYPPYPQAPGQQPNQQVPPAYQATAPLSYPIYPGSAAPQPYPYSNTGYPPYPSSGYPSVPGAQPYPGGQPPYPSGAAYPGAAPAPYPSGAPAPYPRANPAPYPAQSSAFPPSDPYQAQQSSYPKVDASPSTGQAAYPGGNSAYPSGYPSGNPAYPGGSTAYPSGTSYPGGNSGYPGSHGPHPGAVPVYPSAVSSGGSYNVQSSYTPNKGTPTLRPAQPFDPRSDAEILRKAMKGFGTDEKAIIQVLTKRTNSQRQEIAVQFKTLYGKDLIADLKSEVSGKFEDLLVALMTPIAEFLAKELRHAISGIGTNEETLVEVLCTATNNDVRCIRGAYQRLYGSSLEQDLAGDTSGNFRRLLVSLCQGARSENYMVDVNSAAQDAQALLRAGELKVGTDESTFNAILCTRSYPQLAQVFLEYQKLTGHDFEKAIRNEFSGDIEKGLIAIVRSVRDKSSFFATQLYESMSGLGTKDRALIRVVATRCEIDMVDIKHAFQAQYGKTLEDFISGDTTGDYKKALLSLIS